MSKNFLSNIVNEDVLVKIFGFLTCNEVYAFAMTCKRCLAIGVNDVIWKPLCYDDFLIASLTDVPPLYEGTFSGYHALYMAWCQSFGNEYRRAEVRMAKQWWIRMELCLQQCAPQISATLNPPASIHALTEAENELDRPLPRMVKLLYRFHDGQHLLVDEVQFSKQSPAAYPEAEIIRSIFLGMFGGYNFYDELVNVRFLPLKHCVMVTKFLLSNPRNTLASMDLCMYPKWPAKANDNWNKNDSVVFACDCPAAGGVAKFVFVGGTGSNLDNDGVFTNYNGNKYVVPCCRTPVDDEETGEKREEEEDGGDDNNSMEVQQSEALTATATTTTSKISSSSKSSSSSPAKSLPSPTNRLFIWLEEYLRRLEMGVYQWQPLDLAHPEMLHLPQHRSRMPHAISLYPVPDRAIIYHNEYSNGSSGQGMSTDSNDAAMSRDNSSSSATSSSSSSSSSIHAIDNNSSGSSSIGRGDMAAVSVRVTLGVEVAASPLFVPHKGTVAFFPLVSRQTAVPKVKPPSVSLFWSYSVRLRLLAHHPSRPAHMNQCTLTRRHWEFRDHPRAPVHTVTGKGVVGHFPVLKTAYSQPLPPAQSQLQTSTSSSSSSSSSSWPWPFAYQSCTTSTSYPASMKGWLEFRVNGDVHRVHIPPEHHVPGDVVNDDDEDEEEDEDTLADTKLFRADLAEFPLTVPDFIF